jgi:tyrosyl-tRNA synthetase
MDAKMALAQRIIAEFHGQAAAEQAAGEFQRVFRDRRAPEEAPRVSLPCGPAKRLSALLVELNLAASRSDADRLIKQGGVEIGETRVEDVKYEVDLSQPREILLRAGKKKFLRIVVE